jgi:mannose PTS system EIID component
MDAPSDSHQHSPREMSAIPGALTLVQIFIRSLSIQSSWNFSKMQNIGFVYSIIPLVKKVAGDRDKAVRILTRHSGFFNTHPYFASPIIASTVRLEAEALSKDGCTDAVEMKKVLMSPYAAAGDPFFWGAMKPFAAVTGVILALRGIIWAPLAVLLLFNSVHLWFRAAGFIRGYRDGKGAFTFVQGINFPAWTRRIKWTLMPLCALLAFHLYIMTGAEAGTASALLTGAALLGAIMACCWLIARGVASHVILYATALFFLVITALGAV